MKPILVINSGSSSLKYQLIDMLTEDVLAQGFIERVSDHGVAFAQMMTEIASSRPQLANVQPIAVGHRVVHGGEEFDAPVRVDTTALLLGNPDGR